VQVEGAAAPVPIGVVVDAVAEVLSLAATDIEDTPDFGRGIVTPYLLGLAKVKGKVKILLDIGQALSHDDLRGIATLTP
jgi:purine-binding chemotaxis protein CheW